MYTYRRLTPEERAATVENRVARGYPPHQPPHPSRFGGIYMLTAACFEHRCLMTKAERRQQLLQLWRDGCAAGRVSLHGWVIMRNHYHLLAEVGAFGQLGEMFRRVHGRTAHDWNAEDAALGRKVWYRYSDRAMRSEAHYYASLNYMHINPVKHGLAETPYDWEESSVHWYLEYEGRDWLRDMWVAYPADKMGEAWDGESGTGGNR